MHRLREENYSPGLSSSLVWEAQDPTEASDQQWGFNRLSEAGSQITGTYIAGEPRCGSHLG